MKHTPGPWYRANLYGSRLSITSDVNGAFPVAYVPHRMKSLEEDDCNAHLIAAAPDLLEALEEIAKGAGPFSFDHLTHCYNTVGAMKDIAVKAIAKAKGEK